MHRYTAEDSKPESLDRPSASPVSQVYLNEYADLAHIAGNQSTSATSSASSTNPSVAVSCQLGSPCAALSECSNGYTRVEVGRSRRHARLLRARLASIAVLPALKSDEAVEQV